MARGDGEIEGAQDVPEQSTELDFADFQAGKVLPFSARKGTEVGGEGASLRPRLSDPQGMSSLAIELERSVAAAANAAVAKPQAKQEARPERTEIPEPATPPPSSPSSNRWTKR